jgi:transposase
MDNLLPQTVGIDISKATLDVYAHPAGCERQFPNDDKGQRELIDWLAQWQIDRIAYEATGAYHRRLEQALTDLPCVNLNPARARRFAQAAGPLAKTD